MRSGLSTASVALSCALAGGATAGDLNPPAGAVAPTMKALDAIEPRVCVQELPGAVNATHVISEDGAYYLVADIVGEAGKHGVLITAERVSLDLGPYSIEGVPGSLDGVHMAAPSGLGVILIRGDGSAASRIGGFGGDGAHIDGALSVSIAGVTLSENIGDGMDVAFLIPSDGRFESYCAVEDVATVANGGHGALVASAGIEAKVLGVDARSCANGGDGVRVEGIGNVRLKEVDAIENGGDGVHALLVSRQAHEGFFSYEGGKNLFNGGHGVVTRPGFNEAGLLSPYKCSFVGVTTCGNGIDGFRADEAVGVRWDRCSSAKNGGAGYSTTFFPGQGEFGSLVMTDCIGNENVSGGAVVRTTGDGQQEIRVSRSAFARNGSADVIAPGVLIDSIAGAPDPTSPVALTIALDTTVALSNSGDGIRIRTPDHPYASVSLRECRAMRNDGSGVDVRPVSGALLFDIAVNFADVFCSVNGVDGLVVEGAAGGLISRCLATGNAGRGIALGSEATPSFGVRIDECFATANAVGIEAVGENLLLRSGGTHNTVADLSVDPAVFTGPSAPSPAWTETKPYAWP